MEEERRERLRVEVRNQIKYMRRHIKTLKRVMNGSDMSKISDSAYRYNATMYLLKKYLKELKEYDNLSNREQEIIDIAEDLIANAWLRLNN